MKVDASLASPIWASIIAAASRGIRRYLSDYKPDLKDNWFRGSLRGGLFSSSSSGSISSYKLSCGLGWPFTNGYNMSGMSASREGVEPCSGTIRGYLIYKDLESNAERPFALTCYHVIREGLDGLVDESKHPLHLHLLLLLT